MLGTRLVSHVRWAMVIAVVACLASPALAQRGRASDAPSEAELAEARQTFQVGLAHADRGEWEDAAVSFRHVLEVRQAPPVLYNLGAALVALNQYAEAETLLRRVVADESADPALVDQARASLATIAARGGRVTFTLPESSPTTVVFLDGFVVPRDSLGTDVPVVAGSHEVVVRDEGRERLRRTFSLRAGENAEIALVAVPEPASVAAAQSQDASQAAVESADSRTSGPSPERRRRLLRNPWLWTGVGAAVVVIVVVGAVAGGRTSDPVQGDFNPPLVRF